MEDQNNKLSVTTDSKAYPYFISKHMYNTKYEFSFKYMLMDPLRLKFLYDCLFKLENNVNSFKTAIVELESISNIIETN